MCVYVCFYVDRHLCKYHSDDHLFFLIRRFSTSLYIYFFIVVGMTHSAWDFLVTVSLSVLRRLFSMVERAYPFKRHTIYAPQFFLRSRLGNLYGPVSFEPDQAVLSNSKSSPLGVIIN